MRKIYILLIILFTVSISYADKETKLKKIETIINKRDKEGLKKLREKTLNAANEILTEKGIETKIDEKSYEKFFDQIYSLLDEEMKDQYDKRFTESEIDDILNYYNSPSIVKIMKVSSSLDTKKILEYILNPTDYTPYKLEGIKGEKIKIMLDEDRNVFEKSISKSFQQKNLEDDVEIDIKKILRRYIDVDVAKMYDEVLTESDIDEILKLRQSEGIKKYTKESINIAIEISNKLRAKLDKLENENFK